MDTSVNILIEGVLFQVFGFLKAYGLSSRHQPRRGLAAVFFVQRLSDIRTKSQSFLKFSGRFAKLCRWLMVYLKKRQGCSFSSSNTNVECLAVISSQGLFFQIMISGRLLATCCLAPQS